MNVWETIKEFLSPDKGLWAVLASILAVTVIFDKWLKLWTRIFGWVGKRTNAELLKICEKNTADIEELKFENCKAQILDFANALMNGKNYSVEQFSHILSVIDGYELNYADKHNGELKQSIKFIKSEHTSFMREKKAKSKTKKGESRTNEVRCT